MSLQAPAQIVADLEDRIEQLERDLAAARAERDALERMNAAERQNCARLESERDEAREKANALLLDGAAAAEQRDALAGALRAIAEGCSFPADDVQRAVRDRARAALAAVEREEG